MCIRDSCQWGGHGERKGGSQGGIHDTETAERRVNRVRREKERGGLVGDRDGGCEERSRKAEANLKVRESRRRTPGLCDDRDGRESVTRRLRAAVGVSEGAWVGGRKGASQCGRASGSPLIPSPLLRLMCSRPHRHASMTPFPSTSPSLACSLPSFSSPSPVLPPS
eukprot:292739-Rhodomonas_salina.3